MMRPSNILKEYELDNSTFIGGWFMSEKLCDKILNYYELVKGTAEAGETAHGMDKGIKDSLDIPINPNLNIDPWKEFKENLSDVLNLYLKKYPQCNIGNLPFGLYAPYNIQYYPIGGGFKKWHCEDSGNRRRCLAWMTYLNNVEDGGTEFKHQKLTTPAKKGLTLFWPSPWTHTHRGQISQTKEKYIVTGWYNYAD